MPEILPSQNNSMGNRAFTKVRVFNRINMVINQ